MLIAKIENGTFVLDDYWKMFPDTSFHQSGPSLDWLDQHGCYPVSMWRDFDRKTQKLEQVDPYLDAGTVYTVQVVPLNDAELAAQAAQVAADVQEEAKRKRALAVAGIKVTTASGKTFDGDETSQTRMGRAVIAMQAAGQDQTLWVLADNAPATVSLDELAEALALAGAEQTRLWVSV